MTLPIARSIDFISVRRAMVANSLKAKFLTLLLAPHFLAFVFTLRLERKFFTDPGKDRNR